MYIESAREVRRGKRFAGGEKKRKINKNLPDRIFAAEKYKMESDGQKNNKKVVEKK